MPPEPADPQLHAKLARLASYAETFALGGDREAEAAVQVRMAMLSAEAGAIGPAIGALRRGLQLGWDAASDEERAQGLLLLSTLLLRGDRPELALETARLAEETFARLGRGDALALCWYVAALVARALGDGAEARRFLHLARDGFVAAGQLAWAGHTLMELGDLDAAAAPLCYSTAREMYLLGRAPADAARAAGLLGESLVRAGEPADGAGWLERAFAESHAGGFAVAAAGAWLDAADPDRARAAFARIPADALADRPADGARLCRRLAEAELARAAAAEGLRFLERAVPLAVHDRDESAALVEAWVGHLVAGTLPASGWPRIGRLAEEMARAGHLDLAAACNDALATLR